MTEIITKKFNAGTSNVLKSEKYGTNWPVVYIINNNEEAYVGETTDVSIRSNQHWANEVRRNLDKINIIGDDTFNKSSILDLESFLIKYMSADNKFKLQNGNGGLQNHNYYQREMYETKFREIWLQLKSKGLVKNDLKMIANSDLFKYSPYKALTVDQYMIVNDILSDLSDLVYKKEKGTFVVEGGAGTGKTILGIYLLKLLVQAKDSTQIEIEEDQVENIKSKDSEYGLCRNIAGYAWKWNSKGKHLPLDSTISKDSNGLYDIEIGDYKYIWNSQAYDWINSKNAVNEIGSIHTTQGFDLNYTGLIIGNELKYDIKNNIFKVDRSNYYDAKGKADTTEEELLNYLLNIYRTMMTRGMLGTYIYVCDEGLREYLKKYIECI